MGENAEVDLGPTVTAQKRGRLSLLAQWSKEFERDWKQGIGLVEEELAETQETGINFTGLPAISFQIRKKRIYCATKLGSPLASPPFQARLNGHASVSRTGASKCRPSNTGRYV